VHRLELGDLAISLAQQGASLVLGARNQVALEETVAACATGRKGDHRSNGCDSTRTMSAVDRAGDRSLWANDVLVNNAGISMLTPLVRLQTSPFLSRSCRSTTSVLSCTHYAL